MTESTKRKDKDHLSAERAAKRKARQARREKALEYRRLGLTYDAIGKLLGVPQSVAWADVKGALKTSAEREVGEIPARRQLELERTDLMLRVLAKRVREGDEAAIDRWLRVCELRRKLLGLDARGEPAGEPVVKYIDLAAGKGG